MLLPILLAAAALASPSVPGPELTADEIRERLVVTGEVFVVDDSGKRLEYAPAQVSTLRGSGKTPIESNWGNSWKFGHVYLHHRWTVEADGRISVLLEEFAHEDADRKFTDLLKRVELTVDNFAPVTWKVLNGSQNGLIVRLTPSLAEVTAPKDAADLPVAARNVIVMDNKGFLWTEGGTFDGRYVGLTTHRGTVAISYKPFAGAKLLGVAEGREIRLTLDGDLTVKLHSDTDFVPAAFAAKVYGIYRPDLVAKGPHSTHTFTSSQEESILKTLDERR